MTPEAKVILTAQDRTAQAFRAVRANLGGLEQAASMAQRALGAIGVGLSVGVVVTGLTRAAAAAIEFGDEVLKASKRTGLGAAAFAELAEAARMADVDMATLSKGLRTMQIRISEAGTGAKGPAEAFRALGIEVKDLIGLNADQQLELIFEQISRLESPLDRARAGTDLFGKAWESLAPLAAEGAAGLRAAREEIQKLGLTLTDDQIEKLADADDAVKRLSLSWDNFARTLTAKVAPALSTVLDSMIGNTSGQVSADLGMALSKLGDLRRRREVYSRPGYDQSVLADINAQIEATEAKVASLRLQLYQINGGSSGPLRRTNAPAAGAAAPGFTPDGLDEIVVWQREVFNLGNEMNSWMDSFNTQFSNGLTESMNAAANQIRAASAVIEEAEEPLKTMSVYAEQAASNMQDAFAQFFYDFDGGLKGMLASFADTLRQMVAQMAASKIFDWLGTALAGSGNAFVAGIGNFIAGARASGGPVSGGSAYLVGERGPELFVPGSSGQIIPNGMGGITMNQDIRIDARGGDAAQIMAMLPAWGEQIKRQTVAEVINLQRRGRLA